MFAVSVTNAPDICAPDGAPTNIQLPLIALERLEFGRVVLLGSFEILTNCSADSEAHMIFCENLLRWAGGPPIVRTALFYGFSESMSSHLISLLHGLGSDSKFRNLVSLTSTNTSRFFPTVIVI
jgi:hypothetical protein